MSSPPRRHRSRSPPRGRRSRWHDDDKGDVKDFYRKKPGRDDDRRPRRGDDRRRRRGASPSPPPPPPPPPPEPEFGLSGALAQEANERNGVALLHAPPADAARPPAGWRLYTFKGDAALGDPLPLDATTCRGGEGLLFGRDRRVADVPTDHASCSKQHAVLLFRRVTTADGDVKTRPYVIDLGSANGTKLNGGAIEAQRYVELRPRDVLAFGSSSREYVLVHESESRK